MCESVVCVGELCVRVLCVRVLYVRELCVSKLFLREGGGGCEAGGGRRWETEDGRWTWTGLHNQNMNPTQRCGEHT